MGRDRGGAVIGRLIQNAGVTAEVVFVVPCREGLEVWVVLPNRDLVKWIATDGSGYSEALKVLPKEID